MYDEILKEIEPSAEDRKRVIDFSSELIEIILEYAKSRNVDITCELVGSMAKKTSLIGKSDIDIFMVFPLDYSIDELKEYGLEFGEYCIEKVGGISETRFASHPYTTGLINDYEVDFVPCYNIRDSEELKSAVDRSILHTKYVQKHMPDEETRQVLLLKKFMSSINTYGANYKVSGFSGYLCELLILKYHSFENVIDHAANEWDNKFKIDLEEYGTSENFNAPLIVIDPVDKNRNVAAALSMQKFSEFIIACRNYLSEPKKEYFCARKISVTKTKLEEEFLKRGTTCYILSFDIPELPDDVIYPQINKTMLSFVKVSQMYDFDVIEKGYYIDSNKRAHIILEYEVDSLSNIKIHEGPQVRYKENGKNFKEKYPDAYIRENKWISISQRKYRTVAKMIGDIVKEENRSILKLGKNVKDEITDNYDLNLVFDIIEKENEEELEHLFMYLHPDYKLSR
ncbi:MAG: CCA tRNA nucleotidyltransferase [Methanosphaera sp. rholeuAM270]|nr:MAG: CCA tRNA nucleotidyltransferase [Methanosphaera sp. rholeuAM270]